MSSLVNTNSLIPNDVNSILEIAPIIPELASFRFSGITNTSPTEWIRLLFDMAPELIEDIVWFIWKDEKATKILYEKIWQWLSMAYNSNDKIKKSIFKFHSTTDTDKFKNEYIDKLIWE